MCVCVCVFPVFCFAQLTGFISLAPHTWPQAMTTPPCKGKKPKSKAPPMELFAPWHNH